MNKILIVHDTFLMKGGAERMNIEIAKILSADIATTVWKSDCYDARSMGFEGKIIEILPNFRKGILGFLQMKWAFFRRGDIYEGYDTVIFSNEAITGIWNIKKGIKTLYYAHSISRHLFDQREDYMKKVKIILKPFVGVGLFFLKILYKKELSKIDTILTNSPNNINRLKEWLKVDSHLLSPPVDTEIFSTRSADTLPDPLKLTEAYFLSFARMTHAKRVNVIIKSFQDLGDKHLLTLFGRHDSQREEFIRLAGFDHIPEGQDQIYTSPRYPNIHILSLKDNTKLPDMIRGSIATIALSKEEDFGMVAIESMACGIPVIAVDEGGYRETVLDQKTGILIDPEHLSENLKKTIREYKKEAYPPDDCTTQAAKFSLKQFRKQLIQYVN